MKTILVYGDSNTWGYHPDGNGRIPYEQRYTTLLQQMLGEGYIVIAEGMNGRTTSMDDPAEEFRNGAKLIAPVMITNAPIDLVIIMLGTNDLKDYFSASAFSISKGMERLIKKIKDPEYGVDGAPKVLVVSPIKLHADIKNKIFGDYFNENSQKVCAELPRYFKQIADLHGCAFFDASTVAAPSDLDGLHLDVDQQPKLAKALCEKVREIL